MDAILAFFSENFWATAILLATLTTPITSFLNERLNLSKIWKQVMAWVVSIVLVGGSYFLHLVEFSEPFYVTVPLTGLLVGLSANGIYDIPTVKETLKKWFGNFKKAE